MKWFLKKLLYGIPLFLDFYNYLPLTQRLGFNSKNFKICFMQENCVKLVEIDYMFVVLKKNYDKFRQTKLTAISIYRSHFL